MAEKPGREIPPKVAMTDEKKALINRDNTIKNCPVCNNNDLVKLHHVGQYGGINRVFCEMCGVVYFALHLPTTMFYGPQYNRFLWNPPDLAASCHFANYIKTIANYYHGKAKGLEIGPGSGYTLLTLKLMGYDFEGIELNKEWADELRYRFDIKVFSGGFLKFDPGHRYQIICGAHIIEHFEDAHAFWTHLNELTEVLGIVFLTAPDIDQSSNYNPEWHYFKTRHPWEHACLYGYRALEFAARNHGFKIVNFFRNYGDMTWGVQLRKEHSITQKGIELDKITDAPPFIM